MIQLTDQPIDSQIALRHIHSCQAGAVVLFLGTTREYTHGRQTVRLEYEAYTEMAERKLADLETQARERWPLIGCVICHRLGPVELGEASVLVAVSTPHRSDAFEAAAWLMDMIKQDVPIWKQDHGSDGTRSWVHPGDRPDRSSIESKSPAAATTTRPENPFK